MVGGGEGRVQSGKGWVVKKRRNEATGRAGEGLALGLGFNISMFTN